MKLYITLLIILLVGCQPALICDAPYIENEDACCLDEDDSGVCDDQEVAEVVVTNFEECAAAGNPVMESYPRQCSHGDETFTEEIEVLEPETEEEIIEEEAIEEQEVEEITSELFTVDFEVKKNEIKVRDEAVFLATAFNKGDETDLFIISTANENWDVKTYPLRNPVSMATRADASSRLTVNLAPKSLEPGEYKVMLDIESDKTGQKITRNVNIIIS